MSSDQCGHGSLPGCGRSINRYGDHTAACPRSGLLQKRAKPLERAWVRVTREGVGADGQVVPQQWLAHTTAAISSQDRRRLDFVVYGADPRGRVLCCDATLVSPVCRDGSVHARADSEAGVCMRRACRRKRRRYSELLQPGPEELVVLACEVGGRWHRAAIEFVKRLVTIRVRRAPRLLRASAAQAWSRRWWSLLSVACQDVVSASLVEGRHAPSTSPAGFNEPPLADVLTDAAR